MPTYAYDAINNAGKKTSGTIEATTADEALKKIRAHRGLRHYWGLKVRGQHTGTTGRGRAAMMAAAAAGK